ncbi:arylesterase [Undibacterium sp. CCC2.1]|nr:MULTISPECIES: arylesterase [unclassified Undibacterium]MEB0138722.1 arylesterase [Undibacterium sp. CCC2.1]MEB0171523.1 arylesterase [Undibacterium sp. CCC1.1]MEB0175406.1 arylesterase [Undibacterium sp. CCC3.4]MEB0214723.1 arylesterase [Undibacterium sp. 5I2]WPX45684.1 arylesterase [Undibacterium sp. CCC3.4]
MFIALSLSMNFAYSAAKTVLVLGDSLSAEYGLARGQGWVSLLEKKIIEENLAVTVVNASISGETTSGGRSRLPALLKRLNPDIVIIELGGNDALRGLALNASEDNFRTMITSIKQSQAAVLLVGMQIPPNYGKDYTERFFSIYGKLAQEQKISLVPFLLEGIAERSELFQADRIHPLATAHPVMLANVWKPLLPLLKKTKQASQ